MSKYVDGYKPKIEYWNYKLTKAVSEGNVSAIKYAADKIAYFVQRKKRCTDKKNWKKFEINLDISFLFRILVV